MITTNTIDNTFTFVVMVVFCCVILILAALEGTPAGVNNSRSRALLFALFAFGSLGIFVADLTDDMLFGGAIGLALFIGTVIGVLRHPRVARAEPDMESDEA